jgi:hypothetical protein
MFGDRLHDHTQAFGPKARARITSLEYPNNRLVNISSGDSGAACKVIRQDDGRRELERSFEEFDETVKSLRRVQC